MLINEIKRYIRNKSLSQLSKETKIARNTFYSLLRWGRVQKETLDYLYSFFWLAIDDYYIGTLQKRHEKSEYLPWQAVKLIRISIFGMNFKEFADKMGVSERTLRRIESGGNKQGLDIEFFEKLYHELVLENEQSKIDH